MSADKHLPVYWDDLFLEHRQPDGSFTAPSLPLVAVDDEHPDKAARVQNIKHIIEQTLADYTEWKAVEPATKAQIESVHDRDLIDDFESFCAAGGGRLERALFTGANEHTYDAAVRAAGAAIQAAERTVETDIDDVPYALVRPSGHHAQPAQMDGFCYFNSVAIATEQLLSADRVDSVAIVDWDVHHGNGTQEIFYDREDVLFVSLHGDHRSWGDWHPQTGLPEENGTGRGEGYTVNVPLPHGAGNESYEYVFRRIVEPVVSDFDPDLLLVSAGQDAGVQDPLARMAVTKEGFTTMGASVRGLARDHADGSLAIVQEGGYQPAHLGFLTLGVLEGALSVDTDTEDPFALYHGETLDAVVDYTHQAGRVAAEHWPVPFDSATD